ncbi:2-octaprenyl-6-methoxyphenyl hydroxylase [Thermomonas flagellata]|uniref:2-octaprenyl-6-methoxyphenyl hydroxylase n=1 Tax=Thermomonas flagellata TaxID=2888524 RepID=UPI001F043017|nr:2-octaprenyl-6-methoxyphenyl hydroxylase [Thermomonas flagellata]
MPSDSPAGPPRHDVLIVGGGLVGASLALALHGSGLDVALAEAAPPGAPPPVYDQRNLSLAEASVHALQALGVWARLAAPGGPIRRIHVSRAGEFGRLWLDAADFGRTAFGQVVVAADLGRALEAGLQALPGLVRYRPARCVAVGADADGTRTVELDTADGPRRVQARLLVAADGADSAVRAALGIGVRRHDYGQTLFVARLRGARAPDGTAWERLTADGPTALLPRGDGHYGLVHGVATAQAAAVAALADAAFLARVQAAFGWRAGRFLAVGPRSAYPLVGAVAETVTAPRAVLVGNAAQSLHPLGAQGFNLGLRDALVLAEELHAAAAQGGDPGAPALLARHAQRRGEDRTRTLAFSDGLARLASNPAPWLAPLRSAGLLAIAASPALQGWLVGGAMGYRGDVPRLARGAA